MSEGGTEQSMEQSFSKHFVSAGTMYSTYEKHIPAPLFRRTVELEEQPREAELLICGLGFYEVYVNGQNITKGLLAPYVSNPDDIVYFDCYRVEEYLRAGENVIGVCLGNGMLNAMTYIWDFYDAPYTAAPKLAFTLRAEVCGQMLEWDARGCRCSDSAITFDNLRSGVFYDARLEQPGWNEPGFDDSGWRPVLSVERPRGAMRLCAAEPIRIAEERAPVLVREGELAPQIYRRDVAAWAADKHFVEQPCDPHGYIYDFGVNGAGVFRLKIRGKRGQKISLQFVEVLDEQGRADIDNIGGIYPLGYAQRDIYICKGEGEEEYIPSFTYHGYRYAFVTGITSDQATPQLLTALITHSTLRERAGFSCSDATANTLWDMGLRTDLSNFQYFPVDCPQREKNGWTADAALSAEHMLLRLNAENSLQEWMRNICRAQAADGRLPGIVPTGGWGFQWGNGPAWDCVLFYLPYYVYLYRGDLTIVQESAHAMLGYLEYISRRRNRSGLVEIGLGDWVPVGKEEGHYQAPLAFTDSVMVLDMCRKAQVLFRAAALPLNESFARQLGDEMRAAIRRELVDVSTLLIQGNCQTGQAMGLYYGVFEPGERAGAFARLLEMIEDKGMNFDCGCLGLRVLFHVLSDFGRTDLAFRLITKPEYPSYGHWIEKGLTTFPEMFKPDGVSEKSRNHHFLGDITHWFMRQLTGLNINPHLDDPNEVLLHPHFIDALDWAECWCDLPGGRIAVRWQREGEQIRLTVNGSEPLTCRLVLDPGYGIGKPERPYAKGFGEFEIKRI